MKRSATRQSGKSLNKITLKTGIAAIAILLATPALAEPVKFDIDPQPLAAALKKFSQESGREILFSSDITKRKRTAGVEGSYEPEDALTRLLKGTGLRFTITSRNAFLVQAGNANTTNNASSSADSNEIVVTGSNIRGIKDPTSATSIYRREDIEKSGYASTQDFIRSIPQNFKGGADGASEDGTLANAQNLESGSGINLRGLGAGSTLVLLNGRRLAPSSYGRFFDISMLPLGIIDRVEVLTDGASAIYGADAVGGTVNFVTRKDYTGAETSFRYGIVSNSGRQERYFDQSMGTNWGSGRILGAFQYQNVDRLRSDERSFTALAADPTDLYPSVEQFNGFVSASQDIGDKVDIFLNALVTKKDVDRNLSTASRTTESMAHVSYLTSSFGIGWNAFSDWRVELTGQYARSQTRLSQVNVPEFSYYTNGSPYLRNLFVQHEGSLKADGSLASLPGGIVKLAVGASYRHEQQSSLIVFFNTDRRFRRNSEALFGELYVPIIGEQNASPGMKTLSVSIAGRYDHYSDFGGTFNPKVGLLWSPVSGLNLRASYGKSFRAPNANEILFNGQLGAFPTVYTSGGYLLPDGTTGNILRAYVAPPLVAEKSENLTIGFDFKPDDIPGLTISGSFYDIKYRNRIITSPEDASAIVNRSIYGSLVHEFSDDAKAQSYVDDLISRGYTFYDLSAGRTGVAGIRYAYDYATFNAAHVHQQGFDLAADYDFDAGGGQVHLGSNFAYISKINSAFCDSCVSVDLANRFGQPLKFRARGHAGWSDRQITFDASVDYYNSYKDTTVSPDGRLPSWITVGINASYSPSKIKGTTFSISAINLLDSNPPLTNGAFIANGTTSLSYDPGNANPLGRVVYFQVHKKW